MFSWKPFYRELAQALMAYRDRQDELLKWLAEMKLEGIPVICLEDEMDKGNKVPLTEIDPFSFFANFNRAIKVQYRKRVLEVLKEKMGLKSPVPDDFDGVPVVHHQLALFFPYAYERNKDDISELWKFAKEVTSKSPGELSEPLFRRCLKIRSVKLAKLTMGMFWMCPDLYPAMDSLMLDYLKDEGIELGKLDSLEAYKGALNQINSAFGKDYAQVSRDAYLSASKLPLSSISLEVGFMDLIEFHASQNSITAQEMARRLVDVPENGAKETEVMNRLRVLPQVRDVLAKENLDLAALKKVLSDIWVLGQGKDATRWQEFLKTDLATSTIRDLLDDGGGVDAIARIDAFVEIATANGYTKPNGHPDAPGAAQFASVLLSAVYPELFVDFRDNRWNKLFSLVAKQDKYLCASSSYGWKLVRAGHFAATLAALPVFQKLFGTKHGTWTVAGLAWYFKDGVFKMNEEGKDTIMIQNPMNLILYGPPGTGKTYQTIRRAVEIIDGKSLGTDEEIKKRFDQLLDQSQIGFVTFHQSYSYEDFVEGIRPVMDDDGSAGVPRYECRDGIFKTMCAIARSDAGVAGAVAEPDWEFLRIWKMSLGDTLNPDEAHIYDDCIKGNFIAHGAGRGLDFAKAKTPEQIKKALESIDWANAANTLSHNIKQMQSLRIDMRKGDIVIVSHGNHKFRAIGRVAGDYKFDPSCDYPQTRPVKWLRIFEEPQPKDRLLRDKAFSQLTLYSLSKTDLKMDSLREMLSAQGKQSPCKYVLVIDEINRGNISKILGELITLIEPDKRRGQRHALSVTLPYSNKQFSVPNNLYIIGTMNTADKSIALVDVALRRRFEFEELMPDFKVCTKLTADMRDVLDKLNHRIVIRKDRDHQIGHSYFISVGDDQGFNRVFAKQIIPLLKEYFYNDWDGLRYVLGETCTSSGTFITSVGDAERKWARTLWQWRADLAEASILEQLKKNYSGGATEHDQSGK